MLNEEQDKVTTFDHSNRKRKSRFNIKVNSDEEFVYVVDVMHLIQRGKNIYKMVFEGHIDRNDSNVMKRAHKPHFIGWDQTKWFVTEYHEFDDLHNSEKIYTEITVIDDLKKV